MSKRLSDLTARSVSLAVQQEAQRTGRNGKRLTAKTIQNEFVFLSSVLRENGVDLGPVPLPEVKRKIVRIPEPPEVIRAVVGSPLELPCLLAAWLSLSLSEIRGLTKSKSLLNGQLYVAETVVRVRDESAAPKTKKDGSLRKGKGTFMDVRKEGGKEEQRSRVLDLPPYLARLIDRVEGDVIVPLTAQQISGGFSRLMKAKGLPHMTFHQLRHLNASAMAMLGIQKEIAQERGGWKTPHTMNQVYTHTFTAPRLEADKKINAYFESLIPAQKPAEQPANANESLTKSRKPRIYRLYKG
jgi:integrase